MIRVYYTVGNYFIKSDDGDQLTDYRTGRTHFSQEEFDSLIKYIEPVLIGWKYNPLTEMMIKRGEAIEFAEFDSVFELKDARNTHPELFI